MKVPTARVKFLTVVGATAVQYCRAQIPKTYNQKKHEENRGRQFDTKII